MHIHKELTCFVIGEGTLPIQCASLLLERGDQIFGIISPDALISDWAKTKGIPHILPTDNLIAFLSQKPFDYLFSIVNSYLLPKEILKLPRKVAINYLNCHAATTPNKVSAIPENRFTPVNLFYLERKLFTNDLTCIRF